MSRILFALSAVLITLPVMAADKSPVGKLPGLPGTKEEGCFGTKVEFVDTPKEAAALAKKQEKLVFVLHVSGYFEDPRFT